MSGIRPEGYQPEIIINPERLVITTTDDFQEVIQKARSVTLLNDSIPGFHPYLQSKISLVEVPIDQLHPCSLYVLKSQLENNRLLREQLIKQGIDPLRLTENRTIIHFDWDDRKGCVLSPPIVEFSEDDGGILVLVDALHRIWNAREQGEETVVVILFENVACPLQPLPVRWEEIKVCQSVPPSGQKKRYRFESPEAVREWLRDNPERVALGLPEPPIRGLDFREKLGQMHILDPEQRRRQAWSL